MVGPISYSFFACNGQLLRQMQSMSLRLSSAGLYLGASARADDVRTVTSFYNDIV